MSEVNLKDSDFVDGISFLTLVLGLSLLKSGMGCAWKLFSPVSYSWELILIRFILAVARLNSLNMTFFCSANSKCFTSKN